MKIVFMGTPDLAAGILETMLKDGRQVSLVIERPRKKHCQITCEDLR